VPGALLTAVSSCFCKAAHCVILFCKFLCSVLQTVSCKMGQIVLMERSFGVTIDLTVLITK